MVRIRFKDSMMILVEAVGVNADCVVCSHFCIFQFHFLRQEYKNTSHINLCRFSSAIASSLVSLPLVCDTR